MKLSLYEIELAVARKFGIRENIIVPNISWGFSCHECDLFIIKKSGYAVEVEIKRSVSDLRADFKKEHNHKDSRIKELYYAVPDDIQEKCKDLIPADAGIIVIYKNDYGAYAKITKPAKIQLNSRKLTADEHLAIARLGTLRIWSLKHTIIGLTSAQKKLRRRLKVVDDRTQLNLEFV